MYLIKFTPYWIFLIFLVVGCTDNKSATDDVGLFEKIELSGAGIDFVNELKYTEEFNIYTFRNFYNGAGVGLGDFNNDGLTDLFFCGNQVDNKLYLNKGSFSFLDITDDAGVSSPNVWSTGVSIVDINGDGWLDLYICKSGDSKGDNRHNELFINQGVIRTDDGVDIVSFKEESKAYGLDDLGLSTHAAFLDYDLDGDLDCYLLNNSFRSIGNYDLRPDQRSIRDTLGGNKLFRNNLIDNHDSKTSKIFEDVSEEAGIYGSSIGFGLGVTFGDVNNDGWPDIYVSNDFFEKDYLYINNQDGTFTENVDQQIRELSMGSMGADMADINNDGYTDIFVTEMLPRSQERQKTKSLFEDWNKYSAGVEAGYHKQFARNVLQVNTGEGHFQEVGRMAGVEATDWSWGALIFDMNNDGWKDLYVANGIYKDLLDQDYINFYANPDQVRKILFDKEKGGLDKLVDMIPTEALSNFAFENKADLSFADKTKDWGLDDPSFSNGSAYGDMDNDGDLDLVVNNINGQPFIYKNNSAKDNHYVQILLKDTTSYNRNAIGSRVNLYIDNEMQSVEVNPARGFMSTVDNRVHFGIGLHEKVDSIIIEWPDLSKNIYNNIEIDKLLVFNKNIVKKSERTVLPNNSTLLEKSTDFNPSFSHIENDFSDFDREPLLLQMHSNLGPACCTGDVNNDGLSDFYVGGAKGQKGTLFIQSSIGTFKEIELNTETSDNSNEEVDCVFFDANRDAYPDLYIVNGSTEFGSNTVSLSDHLYFNKGGSTFEKSKQILPTFNFENTSSVVHLDYDGDGDEDLIVSSFIRPMAYGIPSSIYLLENDGTGSFKDVSNVKAPEFKDLGMVSDLSLIDLDNDGDDDVVAVGEWMGVALFENNGMSFKKIKGSRLDNLSGLYQSVYVTDLDVDGYQDIVIGNVGLNTRLKANQEYPLSLFINDFDRNGRMEQIFVQNDETGSYPLVQRADLLKKVPYLNKKYPNYKSFALQSIEDIFEEDQLKNSLINSVNELGSMVLWNNGDGSFEKKLLPVEAQLSSIHAITADDVNDDGHIDIIIGGNQYRQKPELGINDASYGLVLLGDGQRELKAISIRESGLFEKGEIRQIVVLKDKKEKYIFAKNNNYPEIYEKAN